MANVTLQASADTYIEADNPTTNRDTATDIYVGESNLGTNVIRSLIKFDLSSLAGNTITLATLKLYEMAGANYSANARTGRVYRVKRAWVSNQATWNVFSTGNNWGTAGCANTTSDREATDIGTFSFPATEVENTEYAFSLTPIAVEQMADGAFTNNGFLIQMDTETDDQHEVKSSAHADTSYRPVLYVEYTLGKIGSLFYSQL